MTSAWWSNAEYSWWFSCYSHTWRMASRISCTITFPGTIMLLKTEAKKALQYFLHFYFLRSQVSFLQQWSHIFPISPFIAYVLREAFLLVVDILPTFNSIWTLVFIISFLHASIFFPGYLSLLPSSFFSFLSLSGEFLVHSCRLPSIFNWYHIPWDGALRSLEEVLFEY